MLVHIQLLTIDEIGGDFQSLQLIHQRKVDPLQVVCGQLQDQVLQVDELAEEVAFVHEPARPLQIQYPDTLANGKVATVGQEQSRVLVLHVYAQL